MPSTLRSGRAPGGSAPSSDDVDADRAVGRGRVDARDLALDDAVARVDLGDLADADVLGLRFRDAQFGLEDASDWRRARDCCRPACTCAPTSTGSDLQHAVHAGLDLEIVEPAGRRSTRRGAASMSASCGASCDFIPARVISRRCSLDRQLVLEVLRRCPRFCFTCSYETKLRPCRAPGWLRAASARLAVVGFDRRDVGFLREQRALEVRLAVLVGGLRRLEGQLRIA